MELPALLVLTAASAVAVHLARYWQPLAFVVSVALTALLVWAVNRASPNPFELLGLTFSLSPLARDFLLVALAISGGLAVATSLGNARRSMGFMLWSWIAWLVALVVNDFVIGVFAWASGLALIVIAMEPRRYQRVGGAAYYLVLIIVGAASLLLAHRFVELYPLTPDQVVLIDSSVLFLAWGLGLLLALAPFQVWLGPMADEAPPATIAVLLGLGQPIGLWLLYMLIGQYPRLVEQSSLLRIMSYASIASIVVGGALALLERRVGRLMSSLALFALGFILLDLSRGSLEGTANAVVETFSRALGLAVMGASVTIARNVDHRWIKRVAIVTFVLGGLNMTGLRFGVALTERWNLLTDEAASNQLVFYAIMLATLASVLGIARFAGDWLRGSNGGKVQRTDPVARQEPRSVQERFRQTIRRAWQHLVGALPRNVRRAARLISTSWRVIMGMALLVLLAVLLLGYGWTPGRWFEHALETVSQLPFLQ